MSGWLWAFLSLAHAGQTLSVRACDEAPHPGDVKWAIARTVTLDVGDGSGTGVLISPDGFVLTADHVIANAETVQLNLMGGEPQPATVVRRAPEADLALLHVDGDNWPCIPIRATPADVGGDTIVVGSPGGSALSHSVTKGIVSGYREVDGRTLVQTDATINAGNSGGPLVGETGELIGVVSFKMVGDGVEGLGFAVASTNIPSELSLRWGASSDAVAAVDLDGGAKPGTPMLGLRQYTPRVEPGAGVTIPTTARYDLAYRPRMGWAVSVGACTGVGAALALIGFNAVKGQSEMAKTDYDIALGMNLSGLGLLGAGLAQLPLVILPRKSAPIRRTETP